MIKQKIKVDKKNKLKFVLLEVINKLKKNIVLKN